MKSKSKNQVNSRYTLPTNRHKKSYRKFVRANKYTVGLTKYFN